MTARVFVPLVGANGAAEQLFEAIASDARPEPHPAQLLPQIAELYDFGLYRIGQTVREAVQRVLDERSRRVWLGRRNARLPDWYLRISELQVGRLSDENARSAGLGLVIAALLHVFGRDPGVVFATGEIVLPDGPGERGVAVGPVGGIRGKLSLVGDYLAQHRAALAGVGITLVLPRRGPDGRSLADAEARPLARLHAEAEAAGAALNVLFVDDLDDVEAALGPFEFRALLTPGRAVAAGVILLVAAALGSGWLALANAPVALAWAPIETEGAPDAAGPQRARYDAASDSMELLPACFDDQRQPVVVGGEMLLLRVRADDGLPFASDLRPPRFFVASVSREADPIILDAALFGAEPASDALLDSLLAVPVEASDDEIRLFVVATRDPYLQAADAAEELKDRLAGLSGAAVLATTASYLQATFDAQIDYQFRVTRDDRFCPA